MFALVLARRHKFIPTGQGFRALFTSDDNREINPVNASTPNARFEMKTIAQEPATTSDKELKTVHAELNVARVEPQKVDPKIAQVEDSIKTVEDSIKAVEEMFQVVFRRKFGEYVTLNNRVLPVMKTECTFATRRSSCARKRNSCVTRRCSCLGRKSSCV
jgi:hypothetical protein